MNTQKKCEKSDVNAVDQLEEVVFNPKIIYLYLIFFLIFNYNYCNFWIVLETEERFNCQ